MHTSDWAPVRALKNGGFEVGEPALPLGWWRGGLGYDHFSFGWLGVESWEGARADNVFLPGTTGTVSVDGVTLTP